MSALDDTRTELLVLGLGNIICTDDGAGVVAVERLRDRYEIPDGVRVLDGGTLGLSLLPHLQDARHVILVDAVGADAVPGTLVRIEGEAVGPAVAHRLSPHQVGVADLLDGVRLLGGGPESITLLGIVPESLELSVELTPAVARGIDALVAWTIEQAATHGFVFRPRAPATRSKDAAVGALAAASPATPLATDRRP